MTNNLVKRIYQHKNKVTEGFTSKYNITKLVYFELFDDIQIAIEREKQLKGGSRKKKLALIKKINPEMNDLYESLL